jgi:hypothetical protein
VLTFEKTSAVKMGAFGGVALFGVIFFASGIPRVQQDILMKIPFIGNHYIKEIPASDNVRNLSLTPPAESRSWKLTVILALLNKMRAFNKFGR